MRTISPVRLTLIRGALQVAPNLRRVAAGYAAKVACSAVFLSGRELDDVRREDLQGVPGVELEVDRAARSVVARVAGTERRAVYREGLGAWLCHEDEVADWPAPPPVEAPARDPNALWPEGEARADDLLDAEQRRRLERALDAAFAEPDPRSPRRTRAVVVVHRGRIVGERYAEGYGPETRLLGWSMTKSLTNALVGALVERGLDVSAPLPAPEWGPGDRRAAITWDAALRMSSGLKFWEQYWNPLSHVAGMLFRQPATAEYAASFPLVAEPDTRWSYSSGTSNLLARAVRDALGGDHAAYLRFPREALFGPLGMHSAQMELDASGHFVGSSFSYATARDWARFGLLYLQDGLWGERRILPAGWVARSARPTPAAPLGQYGAHWWLNAGDQRGRRIYPDVPRDAFFARGFEEQSIGVIPSRDAVIVRLGQTADEVVWDLNRFTASVLDALP